MDLGRKILREFGDSKINAKVAMSFVPIAFLTYFFHESGHYAVGELLGNRMTLSLNNSTPVSGSFADESDALWSAIGGPAFTFLQGLIFLTIVYRTHSVYAFSILFFASFSRFFSLLFGGLSLQDEGRIANMLDVSPYLVAAIVLGLLAVIVWFASRAMNLGAKSIGHFVILSTVAMLLVIGTDQLIASR